MKHIVITGGTRGIGLGLTKEFLKQDCKVTFCGTSSKTVKKALLDLNNKNCKGFICDVSSYNDIEKFCKNSVEWGGEIDIWINNAGINQPYCSPWLISENAINNIFSININGVVFGTQIAYNYMVKQRYGQIFNMEGFGSDGRFGDNMTLYGTSKRAIRYYTKSFAKENKNNRIVIGTISPGMVLTDFFDFKQNIDPDEFQRIIKIYNILADKVETVAPFLVHKMLLKNKNGVHYAWLTNKKVIWRFLLSLFKKRDLFND